MKLIVSGNGRAGSWFIRGEQIGAALGATINPNATANDYRAHDVALVVKRVPPERLAALRAAGRPWVFDVVDFYPQPECSSWDKGEAIRWARRELGRLQPSAVIWPNARMRDDVGFNGPQAVIYHHHRPHIRRNPIRKDVLTVAYEGASAYVERWRADIEAECAKRGWRFVLNPPALADADIVLALRSAPWQGYVSEHWKSNVKLANAQGSGTPFVGTPEAGYRETASGAEYFARDLGSLRMAFDWLTPQRTREDVSERLLTKAYTVDQAAADFRAFLCAAKF